MTRKRIDIHREDEFYLNIITENGQAIPIQIEQTDQGYHGHATQMLLLPKRTNAVRLLLAHCPVKTS